MTYKATATVSKPFRILTAKSVYTLDADNYDSEIESLSTEQNETLEQLGYELAGRDYLIRFGKNDDYEVTTIDEAIQCLALKDGCDLVEFENGNIGFVSYCNSFRENYFEVINTAHNSEHTEVWSNHIVAFEDDLCWLYIIKDESKTAQAVDLIEQAIDMWYNTEEFPEYESSCIGDIIDEQLDNAGIEYRYIDINY